MARPRTAQTTEPAELDLTHVRQPIRSEFLRVYVATGSRTEAANAVGKTYQAHYEWLKDPAYVQAYEAARAIVQAEHTLPLPPEIADTVPCHPDGSPMLRMTKRGTLERTKYLGKLWGLPPAFVIPQKYIVTSTTAKRKGPKCGVKKDGLSSSGEGYCSHPAGWGTSHIGSGPCKLHGGALPNVNKKHLRLIQGAELATYGTPIAVDPHTAVLNTVHATAGHVAWLYEKIQELAEVEGDMTLHQYTSMGIKASIWVEMYERERLMLLKASKAAVDMGVSERAVQLAEEQGRMIAGLLQKFIDSQEIGLTAAQRLVAPKVIRQLLVAMPQVAQQGESVQQIPEAARVPPAALAQSDDEWEDF